MSPFNEENINFSRLTITKGVEQLDKKFIDLASCNLGGKIIECSDQFFAEASNLIKPYNPVRKLGKYTERGAWMDGWESKRHNSSYDWVVIKLGFGGHITGFDIDTAHFDGNQAPLADVEACYSPHDDYIDYDKKWHKILPKVDLGPNSQHFFEIQPTMTFTHVKLNIYPDGGVARFRVYGTVSANWPNNPFVPLDLAYAGNMARVVSCSDQHYCKADNLLLPGRGKDMGDGWETKRSRQPNHKDWVIVKLGAPGFLEKAEVDTAFYKGNYPESVQLEACFCDKDVLPEEWEIILEKEKGKLGPHKQHYFNLKRWDKKFSHVRMTIFPDGGIKRLRIIGRRELPDNVNGNATAVLPKTIHSSETLMRIVATPLTYNSFTPYGHVIQSYPEKSPTAQNSISISYGIKITSANHGTARRYNSIAPVINYREPNISLNRSIDLTGSNDSIDSFDSNDSMTSKATAKLDLFRCSPVSLPFTVRLLERHPYSSQMFSPLSDGKVKGYLVVVCLSNDEDDKPDLSTLKAFVASSTQGISYHPGVWHHPMIALKSTTDFVCLTHTSGISNEDCEETELEDKDFIVIDVPGFS